jgi:putative SOS response-associated peptidase YedK
MCGRFTTKMTWAELVAVYRLTMDAPPHNMRPVYDVCPTDPVDVVVANDSTRELIQMRWGLIPRWWNKPVKEAKIATFNARVETVETKPFFRDAFKRTRCLIPISGYFEWQDTPGGKQPWYFSACDGSPVLTAAGLWDEWKNRETGERLKSCTMIITEANEFVSELHDRKPALLTEEQLDPWLSGEAGTEILQPAPNDYLKRWAVSKRVNSSKADKDDGTWACCSGLFYATLWRMHGAGANRRSRGTEQSEGGFGRPFSWRIVALLLIDIGRALGPEWAVV